MEIKYVVSLILTAAMVCAQSPEAPVFVEQFHNLRVRVERITNDVSQGNISREKEETASRVFALGKLVHRLQEGSAGADLDARKSGARPDKRLLLVEQGCIAMDYLLKALASFIDTDDRIFLSLAAEGKRTIASVTKML